MLDASAVIVKPDVAAAQLDAEANASAETTTNGDGSRPVGDEGYGAGGATEAVADPRRFYGRVTLEPIRLLRDVGQIAEALIAHLNRPDGSNVRITVEIEADAREGFPEDLRRTVSENARTLKFESSEFET